MSAICEGTASSFQYQLRLRGSRRSQNSIARLVASARLLSFVARTAAAMFCIRCKCTCGLQLPVRLVSL